MDLWFPAMIENRWFRLTLFALAISCALPSSAVCMNKYIFRTQEATKQVLTLLTGKLTFQEAQQLAKSIAAKQAPPIEWVEANGKLIGRQFGDLKVVRPMPVGCDDKTSGVVISATFITLAKPSGKIYVKLAEDNVVPFDEQKE